MRWLLAVSVLVAFAGTCHDDDDVGEAEEVSPVEEGAGPRCGGEAREVSVSYEARHLGAFSYVCDDYEDTSPGERLW